MEAEYEVSLGVYVACILFVMYLVTLPWALRALSRMSRDDDAFAVMPTSGVIAVLVLTFPVYVVVRLWNLLRREEACDCCAAQEEAQERMLAVLDRTFIGVIQTSALHEERCHFAAACAGAAAAVEIAREPWRRIGGTP